jgi:hypothetical protein
MANSSTRSGKAASHSARAGPPASVDACRWLGTRSLAFTSQPY